jgi:hypothetical protein
MLASPSRRGVWGYAPPGVATKVLCCMAACGGVTQASVAYGSLARRSHVGRVGVTPNLRVTRNWHGSGQARTPDKALT